MILRSIADANKAEAQSRARSASEVFLKTQKDIQPPFAILYQAEHSMLAGELARAFVAPEFCELPLEAVRAAGQHDFGWQASDQAQMDVLAEQMPRPFPALSTEETMPSWHRC